ncbi:hypothetical protein LUX57_13925 [Actinomadura madurae]|uniref:hypothetical protein n=1 Tax=Actinomadura madurae TaxID=1993 RepID=UPI0020D1FAFB|nr:hypothetical protein [Actinomadura madurae]MCP9966071.1 hypothetical protein [Actinomadura madurae]
MPIRTRTPGAALGERPGERRDHRGGPLVVDASREHHRQLRRVAVERHQPIDLRLPEREARTRPGVAAALGALEHEPAGALGEEPVEQFRGRDVQVRGDPGGLQRRGLRRAPAGDDRVRRPGLPDGGDLGLQQLRRREPEDPGAPGPSAEPVGGVAQQIPRAVAVHQAEREERQAAVLRDRARERGAVADVDHRLLRGDRFPARRERFGGDGRAKVRLDLFLDGPHHSPGRPVPSGERGGERRVLAHGQRLLPGRAALLLRLGAGVDAVAVHDLGLGAVHRFQRCHDTGGQVRLADERELHVEDDAGRAPGHRRRGGVRADPARREHRDVQPGQQLLEQHERGRLAGPPAGLGAPRDDPHVAGEAAGHADRGARLVQADHLDQEAAPAGEPGDVQGIVRVQARRVEQDGADRGRQVTGPDLAPGRHADAERARPPAVGVGERGAPGRAVGAEVEDAGPARARDGHREMRRGTSERGDPDDLGRGPAPVRGTAPRHVPPAVLPSCAAMPAPRRPARPGRGRRGSATTVRHTTVGDIPITGTTHPGAR